MALNVVIMAAGKGTRMRSQHPKVLQRLAGQPLIAHVWQAVTALEPVRVVAVTGFGAAAVQTALEQAARSAPAGQLACVKQEPQLGTGHAVQQAAPALDLSADTTLILNGDVPLISAATLRALVAASGGERLALLTIALADPTGYGRIVRSSDGQQVLGIVEQKDASAEQRAIDEVYTGSMAAPTAALLRWLDGLTNHNAQGEYYLTDVVAAAAADGVAVVTGSAASETEVLGINSPAQLADLERRHQRAQAEALMEAGVRLADPARLDVRGTLRCGQDVEIDVGCVFEGRVVLADGVRVGPYCVIRDAEVGAGVQIAAYTHIDGAGQPVRIGAGSLIGPFARLRPGAVLAEEVHIGNFVEVKNSQLAKGAKANHLAYLGDASVGERVNYGAGSITANYDGVNKHRSVIEAGAHVGSNCVLVAPVTVGAGATIGAGSVITRDAPAEQLTVTRAQQMSLKAWKRPTKKT